MSKARRFDDGSDNRKSRHRDGDDDADERRSRRRRDEDDDDYEDSRSRRGRERDRDESKPFPLVLVLVLILAPMLLVGGYFGVRAMRGDRSATEASADDLKNVRAKIRGHWVHDQGGGERMQLTFLDDDRVTLDVSTRNAGRSVTTNYELIEWGRDRISIRIHMDVHAGTVFELRIEVVSDQQLRVTIANNNSGPRIFTKQALKGKKQ